MIINAAFDSAAGEAVSIYSNITTENDTEFLVIAKKAACKPTAAANTVLLTNNPLYAAESDQLFHSSDFAEAYAAYRNLKAAGLLILHNDLAQYRPDNVIDTVGQKENGAEHYNIDALKNGHWAVLASCLYFYRRRHSAQGYESVTGMMDKLNNFFATI